MEILEIWKYEKYLTLKIIYVSRLKCMSYECVYAFYESRHLFGQIWLSVCVYWACMTLHVHVCVLVPAYISMSLCIYMHPDILTRCMHVNMYVHRHA